MMESFLSILPRGLFGLNNSTDRSGSERRNRCETPKSARFPPVEKKCKSVGGESSCNCYEYCAFITTPNLVCTGLKRQNMDEEDTVSLKSNDGTISRPTKRLRGDDQRNPTSKTECPPSLVREQKLETVTKAKCRLETLPEDVMAHCLSFVSGTEDRFALQCTSKSFQKLSNSDEMLFGIEVGGDRDTGKNGIIRDDDTPDSACDKLTPFAVAGNLQALYMIGIIKSYCYLDVEYGISLLKMASSRGYVRASYALGLVLRDTHPDDATSYMDLAVNAKFLPALQEVLPAREMKAKYGEPNADQLRRHLDHLCLNRLLSRYYVVTPELRVLNTSHCWNPLCGRWAFKATGNPRCGHSCPKGSVPHVHHSIATLTSNHSGIPHNQHTSFEAITTDRTDTSSSQDEQESSDDLRVSRMKMCSRCCRAKYCSKLCQVYDWRSGRHKVECQFL